VSRPRALPRAALSLALCLVLGAGAARPAAAADGTTLEPVRSLDLTDGASRWGTVRGDRVIHQPTDHDIVAVDVATGLVRWKYSARDAPIRQVVRRGDQALVIARDLELIDLEDGTVRWTWPLGCRADGSCQLTPLRVDDDRMLVAGFDRAPDSLMVVDFAARDQRWPSWVRVGAMGRVDADGDLIVVASHDGAEVTAIDCRMGRLLWKSRLPMTGGVGGQPPARMWGGEKAVYVWRAVPNGAGPSRVDVLARATGKPLQQLRSVTCTGSLAGCGIEPTEGSAVAWDAARVAAGSYGALVVHDLTAGTTPVDAQSYVIGAPVTALGRLAVVGDRRGARIRLEARRLPDGALAWERTVPAPGPKSGPPARVLLRTAGAEVYVVWPDLGRVTGLALGDGAPATFGEVDVGGQPVRHVFVDGQSLLLSTDARLVALRKLPLAQLVEELRTALARGDLETARRLDGRLVPLARQLPEAAEGHALMVRFALLQAAGVGRGEAGAAALESARALFALGPPGRFGPTLEFATALNNLLADGLLANGPLTGGLLAGGLRGEALDAAQLDALARVADTFGAHVAALGKGLEEAGDDGRQRILAAVLDTVEVLVAAERTQPAVSLLAALQRSPLRLEASELPSWARAAVAREAVTLARQASGLARGRDLAAAVERLGAALALPYADAVIPGHDPNRLQIEVLRDGGETPQPREVAALAKEAAKGWMTLASSIPARDVDCYEACQRRRATCVRPCVEAAACDQALRVCADGCDSAGQPRWRAPETTPPRTGPTFPSRCL
jgi:outer membrane protein assembly factor BamB